MIWRNPEAVKLWRNPEAAKLWRNPEAAKLWRNPEAAKLCHMNHLKVSFEDCKHNVHIDGLLVLMKEGFVKNETYCNILSIFSHINQAIQIKFPKCIASIIYKMR